MTNYIHVEKENGIATIRIDHPPLNILSKVVVTELADAFASVKEDGETVVVILTGTGEKAFVAGADIKEFPQMIGEQGMKASLMENHRIFNEIDAFPKPTIVMLNGLTLGGGCELALACDMRVAEEHTKIGLPEVKLGIFPGWGGTQRLPRLVGEAKAKEIMFTGESISAEEAKAIGLVNRVAPTGGGMEVAKQLANKISGHSLQTLSRIKKAVDEGLELDLQAGINREADLFEEIFQTEDIVEGVTAFIEKRKPVFKHK